MGKGWGLEVRSWDTHQDTFLNLTQEAQLSTQANALVKMHTFRYIRASPVLSTMPDPGEGRGTQMGRQTDIRKGGWACGWMNGRMGRWVDGRMSERKDGQMPGVGQTDTCVDEWVDGWMDE